MIPTARAILARWRVLFLLGVVLVAGMVQAFKLTHNQGYQPTQPIAYSHKVHAGQLGIDCMYCHTNADKSRHATIPAVETCMGCHSVVRTDRPEIQKLTEYYNSGTPVPWVRIHSLPDHAYFNHAAHVNAGVSCQTCHGPVEQMEVVYQFVDTSMGWCISCHRSENFLRTPERLARQSALNQYAHSYYHQSEQPRPTDRELQAEYDGYARLSREFWGGTDLNTLDRQLSSAELSKVIERTLGYDSFARQEGTRGAGVIDHIKAFQNAPISCNTCHQ